MSKNARKPAPLSIRLLGAPSISWEGRDITARLRYRRSLEVLTYLTLEHGRWHSRSMLADLFWPHLEQSAGRTNLRQIISDLNGLFRHAGDHSFQVSRDSIGLFPEPSLDVDTITFERGCRHPSPQTSASDDDCVADLYQGPLLDMTSEEDQETGFREWLGVQRQSFLLYAIGLIERQCEVAQAEGNLDRALAHAQRIVDLEPSQEGAHERLMRLLAQTGQKNTALRQFERLKTHLATTLDAQPCARIRQLADDIQQNRFPAEQLPKDPPAHPTANNSRERRLLSCLYCEFHPELHDAADEELILEKLVDVRRETTGIIRKYHGFVSDLHGSGLFAYFGFPKAKERAAVLAIQAALDIRANQPHDVQTRIGIFSGSLLVDLEQGLPDVFGQASELAMRLRLIGEIGDITVDETTHMATWREFPYEPMGARQFRGMDQTTRSWRISRASEVMPPPFPHNPNLIGRDRELDVLLSHWQTVRQGHFRCVMVEGIAGIGKSRLVREFIDHARRDGAIFRSLDCLPEYQSSPLTPVKRLFEQLTGISNLDEQGARHERLHLWFDQHWPSAEPGSRDMLVDMLEGTGHGQTQGRVQARAIFQLLTVRAQELARQQPLVIVFEDIHWLDRTTLSLLRYFLPSMDQADVPIMLVLTRRNGYQELSLSSQVVSLSLGPLAPGDAEQLVTSLDKRSRLNRVARKELTNRSAGVPLFIEELYLYQKNRAAFGPTSEVCDGLPTSLQLLLQAEIDELGDQKHLLMTAASIGQEFHLATLLALVDDASDELERVLQYFCRRNLLRRGEHDYHFRHDMIRETAYQMLPVRRRQDLHRRIAESLILDQRTRDEAPELIAHHFENASDYLTAIRWWHHAGRHAMSRQAEQDAQAHFERAHHLMEEHGVPLTKRLDLMLDYSESLIAVEGYHSVQARDMLLQALALAEQQEDVDAQFRALNGIWLGDSAQNAQGEDLRSAQHLLQLARDEQQQLTARFAFGNSSFWNGAFDAAVENLQQVPLVHPGNDEEDRRFMVDDPGGSAQAILSWALWFVDRPEDALAVFKSCLAQARAMRQQRLTCYTLAYGSNLLRCIGDVEGTAEAASLLLKDSRNDPYPLWHDMGVLMQLWAEAHTASIELDRRQLLQTLGQLDQRYEVSGGRKILLSIMAEIHIALDDLPEALKMLDLAVAQFHNKQNLFFAPEIYRLRAICLAGLGTIFPEQIEADLNLAVDSATAQNSPPLLQRALASKQRWSDGETDLLAPDELLARVRQNRARQL